MRENVTEQIQVLKNATLSTIQERYKELFNVAEVPCANKPYLIKKIAYRLQETVCGGLSYEAKSQIAKFIEKYDPINNKALRSDATIKRNISRDRRLPIPGTLITKNYKGTDIRVKILEKGFECNGKIYRTLTAIAKEVTGSHWNGYLFFNM